MKARRALRNSEHDGIENGRNKQREKYCSEYFVCVRVCISMQLKVVAK